MYRNYYEWKRGEGVEPEKLSFSNRWLKDWCKEYQVLIKNPNKRFFIKASAKNKRITDFLKNISTIRYAFTKLFGVDPEIVIKKHSASKVHHRQHMSRKIILSP